MGDHHLVVAAAPQTPGGVFRVQGAKVQGFKSSGVQEVKGFRGF